MARSSKRFGTLTDLGKPYGLTAIEAGQKLKDTGWRLPNGTPTTEAIEDQLCTPVNLKTGQQFYVWDLEKCYEILEKAGCVELNNKERNIQALAKLWISHHREYYDRKPDKNFFYQIDYIIRESSRLKVFDEVNQLILKKGFRGELMKEDYLKLQNA